MENFTPVSALVGGVLIGDILGPVPGAQRTHRRHQRHPGRPAAPEPRRGWLARGLPRRPADRAAGVPNLRRCAAARQPRRVRSVSSSSRACSWASAPAWGRAVPAAMASAASAADRRARSRPPSSSWRPPSSPSFSPITSSGRKPCLPSCPPSAPACSSASG